MKSGPEERVAANETRAVDEYLARLSEPERTALTKMRAAIRSVMPVEAIETTSYGMPAIKYKKRIVIWYAAFKNHCSLFPGAAIIEALSSELKKYATSKGTIQFPLDKPLPIALIKRVAKAKVASLARAGTRSKV